MVQAIVGGCARLVLSQGLLALCAKIVLMILCRVLQAPADLIGRRVWDLLGGCHFLLSQSLCSSVFARGRRCTLAPGIARVPGSAGHDRQQMGPQKPKPTALCRRMPPGLAARAMYVP